MDSTYMALISSLKGIMYFLLGWHWKRQWHIDPVHINH